MPTGPCRALFTRRVQLSFFRKKRSGASLLAMLASAYKQSRQKLTQRSRGLRQDWRAFVQVVMCSSTRREQHGRFMYERLLVDAADGTAERDGEREREREKREREY